MIHISLLFTHSISSNNRIQLYHFTQKNNAVDLLSTKKMIILNENMIIINNIFSFFKDTYDRNFTQIV